MLLLYSYPTVFSVASFRERAFTDSAVLGKPNRRGSNCRKLAPHEVCLLGVNESVGKLDIFCRENIHA